MTQNLLSKWRSSDEEKIESGKGEVVKPEENPVDKSVASVSKLGDETKQVKDAVNKSAPAPEKSEKLKEDEDSAKDEVKMSKMESIKSDCQQNEGYDQRGTSEALVKCQKKKLTRP